MSTHEHANVPSELAERVLALRLEAARLVDGVLSGLHRSPHRGASVVFVEHREYRPGDDLRLLDWRAYARSDRHTIKRFEQETELGVTLVLDVSESMRFGEGAEEKLRVARTLLASIALLARAQGDSVGTVTFAADVKLELPPRPRAVREILAELDAAGLATHETSLARALSTAAERSSRRGVVVIASDLLDLSPGALDPIELLCRRGNDVRVLHVLHRDELEFPFDEPAVFEGREGEPRIEADPRVVRERYLRELQRFLDETEDRCRSGGARYLRVRTDAPLEDTLALALLRTGKR